MTIDDDNKAAATAAKQKHKERFVCRKSIALWYARQPLIAKAKALAATAIDDTKKKPISILSNRCAFFLNISSNSIVLLTRHWLNRPLPTPHLQLELVTTVLTGFANRSCRTMKHFY